MCRVGEYTRFSITVIWWRQRVLEWDTCDAGHMRCAMGVRFTHMNILPVLFLVDGLLPSRRHGGLDAGRVYWPGRPWRISGHCLACRHHPGIGKVRRLQVLQGSVLVQDALIDPVSLHNRSHRHTRVSLWVNRKFGCSIKAIALHMCRVGEYTRLSITLVWWRQRVLEWDTCNASQMRCTMGVRCACTRYYNWPCIVHNRSHRHTRVSLRVNRKFFVPLKQ